MVKNGTKQSLIFIIGLFFSNNFFKYCELAVLAVGIGVCETANSETPATSDEIDQVKLLEAMKSYRPHSVSVFRCVC